MKSTKKILLALVVFLWTPFALLAQYTGGISDGKASNELINSVCANPSQFYAYFGGSGDGNSVHTLINAVCGTPPGGFAYMGGTGDGQGLHTLMSQVCPNPPQFYAYMGGIGDGQGLETLMSQVCPTPPQFYAYFGGAGDGASMEKNRNCAIIMPVADFTASPTTVCVNGNVTFTDLSTNTVGWEWTLPGATLVTPSTIYSQNPVVKYAAAGTYTVTLKARNTDGDDVISKTSYITVGAAATITGTTPGSRCGTGSVTIGATSGGVVQWYDNATGGTLLGTGTTFTTPSISTTTTYYAEAFNGCISSTRTAVIATINTIPTITGNPASRCDAGTVTISANPSAGTVTWYDMPTGGTLLSTGSTYTTPSISSTTTYYAETTSAQGCTSSRIPVVATINTSPTVTSTTPASRCGSGSLHLGATASAGVLNWYDAATGGTYLGTTNSFTTPTLSATQSYFVEASHNGCTSSRIEVVATVNTVPTITSTTPATRCDAGSVILQATASNGTLSWYNAPTGGTLLGTGTSFTTPSIATSTYYYVESNDGTCTSSRTAVLATVNATPSITGTTPSQVCGSGTVTLGASSNAGTLNWYSESTGGSVLGTGNTFTTPSISTTTTYYVEAVNGSCISVRVPVNATVNAIPTITATTNASSCNGVGTSISATPSAGTIYWYYNPTGGVAFASGNTLSVSGASGTYYAEAIANGCSSTREAVTYTSIPMPSLVSTIPGQICNSGSTTIQANYDSGTVSWYDAPSGGTLLGTGSSYTTPIISTSTIYYAEATNGSCTTPRQGVYANVNVTSAPTGNANQSFCNGETVGLIVLSSGSNIVWYDAPVGGNVVPNNTVLVSGTTYYASQNPSGCESASRLAVTMTSGACLGVNDFDATYLKVYPNPVVDVLIISNKEQISKVEITNLLGQVVFDTTENRNEIQINMQHLAAATYMVRIYDVNHKVKVVKVIKK